MAHICQQKTLGPVGGFRLPFGLTEHFLVAPAETALGNHRGCLRRQNAQLLPPVRADTIRGVEEQRSFDASFDRNR